MSDARAEAVEAMAQAERDSYNAEVDVVPSPRQCAQTAEVMLDALLSSGLAVLMGELEQVALIDAATYEIPEDVPLFRLRSGESSP